MFPLLKRLAYSLLFLFLCLNTARAQENTTVRINQYPVVFRQDLAAWNIPPAAPPQLVLLRFSTFPGRAEKDALLAAHIRVLEYAGNHIYAALLEPLAEPSAHPAINGIASFDWKYKISLSIMERKDAKASIRLLVRFINNLPATDIHQFIMDNTATIIPGGWQKKGLYTLELPAVNLEKFASWYGVVFISEPSQNVPLDLDSKGGEGATILNMPVPLGGKGLTGKNISIGHGDNCSGIYHIDQSDRSINYNPANATEHGVLVHGIMAGEGIVDPAGQGIATEGTCISFFFDAVLQQKEELYNGFNTTLTNNSYAAIVGSCSNAGIYDNLSRELDELSFVTTEQLDVFAAGNDGTLVCSGYPSGYANVCGGYQTAKNILTVGSTFRDYKLSATSGRGPVRDGRLKPEICAVGANIYCPIPPNTYRFQSGTSLACPQVTGILALLTERYKQLKGAAPRSDLLKAIAMNGASDFGRPGPDFWYGFGFISAVRSLEIIEQEHYTRNTINAADPAQSFTLNVPPNTAQLKVMLYYHDPAASTSSTTQLVNDLDLTVAEPGGAPLHKPLVLDPSVAGAGTNAAEGTDRLNNAEQVVVNHPVAGTYTVSVSGFSIPEGPQDYVVVYDFVPKSLKLLFPFANASAAANTDLYIYWDAPADAAASTIEFSADNGASWTTIASSLDMGIRTYKWTTPALNSNQCRIRVTSGTYTDLSGAFTINEQPVVSLAADQCAGSVHINWTNVPSADKYYMLIKKGSALQKADSVSAGILNYIFTGLDPRNDYFVAVMPSFSGREGYRSKAIMRRPDNGTCAAVKDGDLALESILSPSSGRRFTSSALGSVSEIKVRVRNQDNDPVPDFTILYQVNGGAWISSSPLSIPANSALDQVVAVSDFSPTGNYRLTVAVRNNTTPDPVTANDTLTKVFRQLPNDTVRLTSIMAHDFESLPALTLLRDTIGLDPDGYWDFSNSNDSGRLRTRIPGSPLVKTGRSISMDVNMNTKTNVNYFTGTFNLSAYDTTADEVRLDFQYELRGNPATKDSNKVWVRGTDQDMWIPAFVYDEEDDTAKLHESGSLSLRDMLRKNGQNFSASSQIRFGQYDTTVIVDDHFGAGLTIDNVQLYKVNKDIELSSIVDPAKSNCDITASPVTVKIKNGTSVPMAGIEIAYSIDGKSPVVELYPGTLGGDVSVSYTFGTGLTGLSQGAHTLKAWVHAAGDDLFKNDTIRDYHFYIAPLITNFPYLESFEISNGGWYTAGRNVSWAHGVLSGSRKITRAASGNKAWKTSLSGSHRSNELSYLVSPCINTLSLGKPMLSFSTAFEIEDCGDQRCDIAYLEYSTDNEQSWNRLGRAGSGTNWYNDEKNQVWVGEQSRWHVASISLPKAPQLKLRFVMSADVGTNLDGIAIDDIHIFDLQQPIASLSGTEQKSSATESVPANAWFYFLHQNELLAAIHPADKIQLSVHAFGHTDVADRVQRQYLVPRSWVYDENSAYTADASLQLFVTDAEVNRIWSDTGCKHCSVPADIYRCGVSVYSPGDRKNEDNNLANNIEPLSFLPYTKVQWIPYDNGYYAQFNAVPRGEFWINDGGITATLPLNTEYITMQALKINDRQVRISWQSDIDTVVSKYQLQRSKDSVDFTEIASVTGKHSVGEVYTYIDEPGAAEGETVYYRLLCTVDNGKTFYSDRAAVEWIRSDQLLSVFPVPSSTGELSVRWTGLIGSSADLSLADAVGKTILQTRLRSENWPNTHVLHLGHLSKGIYYLKMYIGNSEYTRKVVFK